MERVDVIETLTKNAAEIEREGDEEDAKSVDAEEVANEATEAIASGFKRDMEEEEVEKDLVRDRAKKLKILQEKFPEFEEKVISETLVTCFAVNVCALALSLIST